MRDRCCHKNSNVSPAQEIVYPTKEEVVKTYSEETVKHIHPIHTTVVNCHTVKNEHLYPHTTSYENVVNEVEVGDGGSVAGVTDGFGPGGSVGGAGSPGFGNQGGHGSYGGHCGHRCNCGKCHRRPRRRRWF